MGPVASVSLDVSAAEAFFPPLIHPELAWRSRSIANSFADVNRTLKFWLKSIRVYALYQHEHEHEHEHRHGQGGGKDSYEDPPHMRESELEDQSQRNIINDDTKVVGGQHSINSEQIIDDLFPTPYVLFR